MSTLTCTAVTIELAICAREGVAPLDKWLLSRAILDETFRFSFAYVVPRQWEEEVHRQGLPLEGIVEVIPQGIVWLNHQRTRWRIEGYTYSLNQQGMRTGVKVEAHTDRVMGTISFEVMTVAPTQQGMWAQHNTVGSR